MHTPSALTFFTILAWGCGPQKHADDSGLRSDPGHSNNQAGPGHDDPAPEAVSSSPIFEVVGVPFDIAVAPDGRIFVSVAEHAIDVWDPSTGDVETHTDDAGSVFGIAWHNDTLYYTTSNHRQSGALMRLDGRVGTVIATAAGATIFREPRDLCRASDGAWVLADTTLGVLFVVRNGGETVEQLNVPLTEVSALAADEGHVYAGGLDGVVRIPWPGGSPELIDDREVNGLHIIDGRVWASNPNWGVFELGTDLRLDTPELGQPGRMTGDQDLLVTDWGSNGVWSIGLSGLE